MTCSRTLIFAIAVLVLAGATAHAQAPTVMSYQGRLLTNDSDKTPIDGTVSVEFDIFLAADGGSPLWSESWPSVTVTDGVFSVLLGSNGTPLPASLFAGSPVLYLQLTIDSEVATPRQQLGSAPFAMVDEPGNETQDLSLTGDSLALSGDASAVDLTGYLDNTDAQDLSLSGDTLTLSGDPTGVDLAGYRDAKTGLGLRACIALTGIFPSTSAQVDAPSGGSVPFIGEIDLFPYNFCPQGYTECDGQLLQISQNTALFSLIGTTYGGDGESTFGLPDLRGRVALHIGNGVDLGGVY